MTRAAAEEERPVVTVELRGANLDLLRCRSTEVAAVGRAAGDLSSIASSSCSRPFGTPAANWLGAGGVTD